MRNTYKSSIRYRNTVSPSKLSSLLSLVTPKGHYPLPNSKRRIFQNSNLCQREAFIMCDRTAIFFKCQRCDKGLGSVVNITRYMTALQQGVSCCSNTTLVAPIWRTKPWTSCSACTSEFNQWQEDLRRGRPVPNPYPPFRRH